MWARIEDSNWLSGPENIAQEASQSVAGPMLVTPTSSCLWQVARDLPKFHLDASALADESCPSSLGR